MTRFDWQKVQQLTDQLLEFPPHARDDAARHTCNPDPALLDNCSDADRLAGLTIGTVPAPTRSGQMAGHYKQLHLIG